MKFSNGMWRVKAGHQIFMPKQAYDFSADSKSLTIYAPYERVQHRGNTLNNGMMTVKLTSPMKDIIRVKLSNFTGEKAQEPHFNIADTDCDCSVTQTEAYYQFISGNLCAKISKDDKWEIQFFYKNTLLTESKGKSAAYVLNEEEAPFIREQLSMEAGENIYGLGERFSAFIKNGQTVDIWNEDGGTDSEQSYKNIPFYISSKGYGVFVNDPGKVSFEVASEVITKTQFSVPGETMEYFIIGGETLKSVIQNYTALTGRPPLVPAWSFGLWLTTSFTTKYDETTVMSFIDGMLERGIPLTTFHFDCFWMKEFEWCNFLWDERVFPNPKDMLRRIHNKGVKVCVWINPYIAQKSRLFPEGYEKGYFVKTADGDVWQWNLWQAGMALVDFTNPAAVAWYQGYLEELVDMGVDAFKTDFGERIPVADGFFGKKAKEIGISYFDGSKPEKMHNYYTFLYNKAVYEVLERKLGKNQACLFARSATVGGQRFPVHWGGDNLSNYPSMAESLRGGLSLSLCGFGYWSHDIGGFEAGCTPDIFKRWTQFGLLSSHSRYHGNSEYKVPWVYDDEAVAVTRKFTRLKMRLMPYLYKTAVEASATGIPMMRPMLLEFPQDWNAQYLDMQYMLGSALLSAPIFNDIGKAEYYLPDGLWTNILTGEQKQGGHWYSETYDYMAFPLLARENSIIAFGNTDSRPDYDYSENTTFIVYSLTEGTPAYTELYSAQAEKVCDVTVLRRQKNITISVDGQINGYSILLNNIFEVASVENGTFSTTDFGVLITLSAKTALVRLNELH